MTLINLSPGLNNPSCICVQYQSLCHCVYYCWVSFVLWFFFFFFILFSGHRHCMAGPGAGGERIWGVASDWDPPSGETGSPGGEVSPKSHKSWELGRWSVLDVEVLLFTFLCFIFQYFFIFSHLIIYSHLLFPYPWTVEIFTARCFICVCSLCS